MADVGETIPGASVAGIAEPEGVTRTFVDRFGYHRWDIVEAILEDMPPKGYGAGGIDRAKSNDA